MEQNNNIEIIRSITRSLGLLVPLVTICAGLFFIPEARDILTGGLIGSIGTAGVFYYDSKN